MILVIIIFVFFYYLRNFSLCFRFPEETLLKIALLHFLCPGAVPIATPNKRTKRSDHNGPNAKSSTQASSTMLPSENVDGNNGEKMAKSVVETYVPDESIENITENCESLNEDNEIVYSKENYVNKNGIDSDGNHDNDNIEESKKTRDATNEMENLPTVGNNIELSSECVEKLKQFQVLMKVEHRPANNER
jgi:hypothetical protein